MVVQNDNKKDIRYPKSVFFIISNEFCERFSFYGMRTVLSIYLTDMLLFNENTSKIIFHVFTFLVYFFPVFGAMIADSWLGKFKTILYISMVYASGNILLALAATPPLKLPIKEFSMLGLIIIAVGTGGIKPCVSAFGGDQFVLPQQELQLAKFFSMFYFSINAGSLISTAITPILREQVHCFGQKSCFSLAFAVPGILMVISIIVFAFGKKLYKIKPPEGNMVLKVSKCVSSALKLKSKAIVKKDHWLDYAEEKYDRHLINDIKATLRVLVLYLPLPVFWALFDQQGTGWTFQARRMDGDIGFYTILPDQMQVINPFLILVFIPLFEYVIYPAMNKCNFLTTPLKRLSTGGFLVAISFIISAFISMALEAQYPKLPEPGKPQIRIYNNNACSLKLTAKLLDEGPIVIKPMEFYRKVDLKVGNETYFDYEFMCDTQSSRGQFFIPNNISVGYYFADNQLVSFEDDISKDTNGLPKLRLIFNTNTTNYTVIDDEKITRIKSNSKDTSGKSLNVGQYSLQVGNENVIKFKLRLGGVYVILINKDVAKIVEVTSPNNIHMLWLLPQYIIITMGEIMFSITGLEFSYSQAPTSMKSVLQACWLLTTAFGNLLVVIIEGINPFEKQSANFFLYAGIMIVDMLLFVVMAMQYKYVKKEENGNEDLDLGDQKGIGFDNLGFTKSKTDL